MLPGPDPGKISDYWPFTGRCSSDGQRQKVFATFRMKDLNALAGITKQPETPMDIEFPQ
jgi:hypothetical protein